MQMKNFKKAMAVVLTAILLSQVALPLFAYGQDEKYTGRLLMAVNTNYDKVDYASFTTAAGEADDEDADYDSEEAAPDVIGDIEVLSPEEAEIAAKKLQGSNKNEPDSVGYEVGDKKTIDASYSDNNDVNLECSYVGEYCTVWHETEYSEMSKEEKAEKCISLGKEADKIIPLELELLGDVRIDTDKDGKIAIFVYKFVNENLGGYFTGSSLVDKNNKIGNVFVKYGNNDCCDSINLNDYFDSDYEYMITTIAHEYQHYIHCCYCYYGKTNLTYLNGMERYLNEGFSDALGLLLTDFNRINRPTDYFNKSDISLVTDSQETFSYELGFLFCQYLRTRYAALTGDSSGKYPGSGFYKKVLESRNRDNHKNTLGLIADMLYPESEYKNLKSTDERCRQLIVDYWMAALLNEPTGDHGFNGDEWAKQLEFDFSYIPQYYLPGPGGDKIQSGNANLYYINDRDIGDAVITSADKGIVFVALGEDWPTLSYADESGYIYNRLIGTSFKLNRYYAPTYDFLGWSSVQGATEPEYYEGDLISIDKDITLYPVLADNAIAVEEDTAYSYSNSELLENCNFKFTAKNTGYYRFAIGDASIELYDEDVNALGETNFYTDIETATYNYSFYLEQGKNYRFYIIECEEECNFSFSLIPQTYTLTCYENLPGESDTDYYFEREGDVAYYAAEFRNKAYIFKGWAESRDSDVKYKVGELITLDSDLTLYGVWEEPETISEGTITVPYGEYIYKFIPEKSGIYQIDGIYTYREIYEFKEETIYYYGNRRYLEKGKTYYISVENYDSESAEITLYFDDTSVTLTYWFELGNSFVDVHSESGNGKFVVPDLPVYSPYYSKFLGWSTSPYDDSVYKPGDTIYIEFETNLYPVWDQNSAKPSTAKTAFETFNWLLFKFYPLYFRYVFSVLFQAFFR